MQSRTVIMHDQEPLNFDFYNSNYIDHNIEAWLVNNMSGMQKYLINDAVRQRWIGKNLAFIRDGGTVYDRNILVHSELNSPEVEKYRNVGFADVYWWSHAIIARDWYRYAELDPRLEFFPEQFELDFNIYNRAWSGSREYRLKFVDMLLDQKLVNHCNLGFSPRDGDVHYLDHQYKNPKLRPCHDLSVLPLNAAHSWASANYSAEDYQRCWFDVVLETVFDDSRLHLTEKILRPIACGKPFILVAPAGSLALLKRYGFKTFGEFIDESYDQEPDPVLRLEMIVRTMKQISAMSQTQRLQITHLSAQLARLNRQRFFSLEFFTDVMTELSDNIEKAQNECDQHRLGHNLREFRKLAATTPELRDRLLGGNPFYSRGDVVKLFQQLRRA